MSSIATKEELIGFIESPSDEAKKLVAEAYEFAEAAHRGQRRFSGEPYFSHVVETARILAELGRDPVTVTAGLLHDSIEDAGAKPEEIERLFGKEVLFLVQGVTKLGQLRYHGAERHVESLRKLFVAMAEDIRVLMIKLADRLHNMRTLEYVPAEKRFRIALETLEVYAPLAYRLGVRLINRELEDAAFAYVDPEEHQRVRKLIKEHGREKLKQLEKFHKSLIKTLASEGVTEFKSDHRIKNLYSLYKKLLRRDGDIEKIYDIAALRIRVPTLADCYRILGIIHGHWRPLPGRIKDYIAFPKPNGYKSIHTTIFTGDGSVIEIQIRTEEMHRESEFGIASHLRYKAVIEEGKRSEGTFAWIKNLLPTGKKKEPEGQLVLKAPPMKTTETLSALVPHWVKELAAHGKGPTDEHEFLNELKADFFEFRVFTFTPKGDVIDLPMESSPIDFAYAIHTDLGDHLSGAKVNGKLVPLDRKLRNGDIVEIITRKNAKPTSKWLQFAKTALARKQIKSVIEKEFARHRQP